ncbi:MAG: substrate-binding domain-containing protein [Eubacteriales bacterium]|nr:substrate-binding domain-containing protein [Eubacteriales bacterium]
MNHKNRHSYYLTVISGLALILLVVMVLDILFEYYELSNLQQQYDAKLSGTSYTWHCAFITDNYDNAFWNSVYESAREQGSKSDIYVEDFGKNLYITYTTDELLRMAIAANVDAIIVEATGQDSTTALIDEAVEKGIAVSTVYKDDIDSARFSFTGVNSARMGYEYGKLALQHSSGKQLSVMVLLDSAESSAEQRLLISGIGQASEEADRSFSLDTIMLNSSTTFEVDERVRGLLREYHDSVDIIICTDLEQTQAVSQTTIDLNYVGDFTIIGSYQNSSVLEALKNGVIAANLSVDTAQMGSKAVIGLAEYLTLGHTSDYVSVDINTIGRQNAVQLLAAEARKEGGASNE